MNDVMNKGTTWETMIQIHRVFMLWRSGVHSFHFLCLATLPGGSLSLFYMVDNNHSY